MSVLDTDQYMAVGLTILEVLGELQRSGPVMLVVDDAHWADPGSLRALLFALRRLVADAVLVILTARIDELHRLPDGFTRIEEPSQGARLELRPLGFGDVRSLARGRGLPPRATRCGACTSCRRACRYTSVPCSTSGPRPETSTGSPHPAVLRRVDRRALVGVRRGCAAARRGRRRARAAPLDRPRRARRRGRGPAGRTRGGERARPDPGHTAFDRVRPPARPLRRCTTRSVRRGWRACTSRPPTSPTTPTRPSGTVRTPRPGPTSRWRRKLEAAAGQLAASGNWLRAASFLGEAAELSPARATANVGPWTRSTRCWRQAISSPPVRCCRRSGSSPSAPSASSCSGASRSAGSTCRRRNGTSMPPGPRARRRGSACGSRASSPRARTSASTRAASSPGRNAGCG